MKKLFIFCSIALSCSTFASSEGIYSTTFSADTKCTSLSTTTNAPTQILTFQPFTERTWIVNTSTVPIFISSFTAVSLSTNSIGVFQIPAVSSVTASTTVSSVIWSPDGVNAPYVGPMFASANANGTAVTTCIFRVK